MKNKLKKVIESINNAISNRNLKLEVVFFIGFFIIIYTNFLINRLFGMYFLGISLIAYSIYSLKS